MQTSLIPTRATITRYAHIPLYVATAGYVFDSPATVTSLVVGAYGAVAGEVLATSEQAAYLAHRFSGLIHSTWPSTIGQSPLFQAGASIASAGALQQFIRLAL